MQAFEVNWSQWLAVAFAIGLALIVFLFLGFYQPNVPGPPPGRKKERKGFPGGIEVTARGIPPILTVFYIVMGVFIVCYTLYCWFAKVNY
jgi:hypothetical protein